MGHTLQCLAGSRQSDVTAGGLAWQLLLTWQRIHLWYMGCGQTKVPNSSVGLLNPAHGMQPDTWQPSNYRWAEQQSNS